MVNNFKAAIEVPFDVNPLTRLWRAFYAASIYIYPKYKKLAVMVVVHVLSST
jgi:hypothetical protein